MFCQNSQKFAARTVAQASPKRMGYQVYQHFENFTNYIHTRVQKVQHPAHGTGWQTDKYMTSSTVESNAYLQVGVSHQNFKLVLKHSNVTHLKELLETFKKRLNFENQ